MLPFMIPFFTFTVLPAIRSIYYSFTYYNIFQCYSTLYKYTKAFPNPILLAIDIVTTIMYNVTIRR